MSEARAPLQEVKPSRYSVVAQLQLQYKYFYEMNDTALIHVALFGHYKNKHWRFKTMLELRKICS
jgi:hypothetical protein